MGLQGARHVSDLTPSGKEQSAIEKPTDSAPFEVAMLSQGQHAVERYAAATERYTQRRSDSTCGLGDNYRRENEGSV